MISSRYLFIPLLAIIVISCKQKPASTADNSQAEDTTVNKVDTAVVDLPGDKPIPLAQLVVPGISLGQTTINESSENIYTRLGKPDAGDAAMGKSIAIWYANHDTTGYVTQMYFSRDMGNDETSRVKQVRVTSPVFKVTNKLHTGAPLKDAMALYHLKKVATFTDKGNSRSLYDDAKAGIGFEADDKNIITGITVHEPGKDVTTTYLPFFADLKPVK
ncbi:hypothetical protein GWR56_05530 [Mucilaginibacter sp. 14171R-50]|uniref:hypothetical protein n=1 Tax=Mucilaginibacter sp. 14171R-50 TaxID=2703789 RepID=UPI00138C0871|nr:hypothetical protein [Mucilaginibacter sp. 14171R-50]QHS55024.1 hypothetical protein GWR56_05530 [Mucilaginibacter sp. 14171R-50]